MVSAITPLFVCTKIYFHVGNTIQPFISDTHTHVRVHIHTHTLVHPCVLRNIQPTVPAVGLVCALAQISVTSSYTHLNQSSSEHVSYAAH